VLGVVTKWSQDRSILPRSHRLVMLRTCSAIRVIRPLNGRLLVLPEGSCLPRRRPIIATQSCARRFTSTSSAAIGHGDAVASQSGLAIFAPLTNELDRMCPRFEIEADDVEILRGPVEFYEALKVSDTWIGSLANQSGG
jgi:hypothetical protein